MEKEVKFVILVSIFIMALSTAVLIGAKLVTLFGLTFSATAIAYALTFPMSDTIAEVWGKKRARQVVWIGFFTYILVVLMVWLAIILPPAPFWEGQLAYEQTFSLVGRIVLAGLIAYSVSQTHDVWAFHFWKSRTKSKHLWFRNNASTFVSQLIDTVIFITIAFYGVIPNSALIPTIFGQFVVKIGVAVIDTPIVYGLVSWAKK